MAKCDQCKRMIFLRRIIVFLLLLTGNMLNAQETKRYADFRKEEVFDFISENESVKVYLLINNEGLKEYYTANLTGNVCLDGLCKPININIYWDLLGNFKDYTTTKRNTLTKFDHIEFTPEDHIKLKEILADTGSLLKDYGMEDLVDTTVKVVSLVKVDAVTSATNKTFEGAIVPGAVYTVYKLWHFVNSDIRQKVLAYSQKNLFTDAEVKRLLLSGNRDYQYFLIENIPDSKVEIFKEQLIQLLDDKDDFVPLYALSKLPDGVWTNEELQAKVFRQMPDFKNPVRIYILEKLSQSAISVKNLRLLIDAIPSLSGKQLDLAFDILKTNKTVLKKQLQKELKSLLSGKQERIQEYTQDLLKQL